MKNVIMESVLKELEDKKVIDKEDILIIKKHIKKKYAQHTKAQGIRVLTERIERAIDKSLEGLDKDDSEMIKKKLLNDVKLGSFNRISFADIFYNYMSLKEDSGDFLEKLTRWMNLHTENKISIDQLQSFYENRFQDDELCKEAESNPEVEYAIYQNSIALANSDVKISNNFIDIKMALFSICFFMLMIALVLDTYNLKASNVDSKAETEVVEVKSEAKSDLWTKSNLPEDFIYKEINKDTLKNFLASKHSLLAEEPYFSSIINIAKGYNLNPLVLFAITGQEQSFVPKGDKDSKIIANNPFNVYRSWKEYNTNIEDSARIACVTVINLCKDRPNGIEAFSWINRKYSEDKNWYKGVKQLYKKLMEDQGIKVD